MRTREEICVCVRVVGERVVRLEWEWDATHGPPRTAVLASLLSSHFLNAAEGPQHRLFNETSNSQLAACVSVNSAYISPAADLPCGSCFARISRTISSADFVHGGSTRSVAPSGVTRSEEHTSELQSRQYLVCRL